LAAARDIQLARYAAAGLPHVRTNAEAPASVLEDVAQTDAQGQKLLRDAAETMRPFRARLSPRACGWRARLADLDGAQQDRPAASGRSPVLPARSPRDVRHAA